MATGTWDDPYLVDAATGSFVIDYDGMQGYLYFYARIDITDPNLSYSFTYDHNVISLTALYAGPAQDTNYRQLTYNNGNYEIHNARLDTTLWVKFRSGGPAATVSWTTATDPDEPYSFERAKTVDLAAGSVVYDNVMASVDQSWFRFAIPAGQQYTFSAYEPGGRWYFEAYDSAQNYIDWGDNTRSLTISGRSDSDIWITVYPYFTAPDTGTLSWVAEAPPPYVVSNDSFDTPLPIDASTPGTISYDNTGASQGPSSAQHDDGARSIWYTVTPPTTESYVKFVATPSTTDPSMAPKVMLFEWDAGTSYWNYVRKSGTVDAVGVAQMKPDRQYMLGLYFSQGTQTVWDNAGSMSWTISSIPVNNTADGAIAAGQSTTVTASAGGAFEEQYFTITAPISGGLFIVLGDTTFDASFPNNTSGFVWALGQPGSTVDPNDPTSGMNMPPRWSGAPTAAYKRTVEAGEVLRVRVTLQGGLDSAPLRWGISNQVTWGDWQDSSNVRSDNPNGQPPWRPWFTNGYTPGGDTSWHCHQELTDPNHTGTSDIDYPTLRSSADNGAAPERGADAAGTAYSGSGNVGYHGWFAYDTGTAGAFTITHVDVNFFAFEVFVDNNDPTKPQVHWPGWNYGDWFGQVYPILNQDYYNGLPGAGNMTTNAYALRGMAIEWENNEEPAQMWFAATPAASWNRDVGNTWIGNIHTVAHDPDVWQARRSSATLADLMVNPWVTPGDIAGSSTVIYEYAPPTDQASGNYNPPQTDSEFFINERIYEGVPLTLIFTTAYHVNGTPHDTAAILGDHMAANDGGNRSDMPFWNVSGTFGIGYGGVGWWYPNYRLGTYTENLDPIDTSPNADPPGGLIIPPTPLIAAAPNGVDVNFG